MSIARIATPAALMAACLAIGVAASAADRRETRTSGPFTAIGVSAPIRVNLSQGDTESIVVEGDEDALAQLEAVIENGALKLRSRTRGHVPKMDRVKAHVTARNVESLSISGSGDIVAPALRVADLQLSVSGSGDLRIAELAASRVDVSVSGSGDVRVAGKADSITASIVGSGDLKAAKLQVADARIAIGGSGAATLWARNSLSAMIAGSGDLRYYGDPSVRTSIAGSGSVKRAGSAPH